MTLCIISYVCYYGDSQSETSNKGLGSSHGDGEFPDGSLDVHHRASLGRVGEKVFTP
jgi:hypothetical protein